MIASYVAGVTRQLYRYLFAYSAVIVEPPASNESPQTDAWVFYTPRGQLQA